MPIKTQEGIKIFEIISTLSPQQLNAVKGMCRLVIDKCLVSVEQVADHEIDQQVNNALLKVHRSIKAMSEMLDNPSEENA